MGFQSQCPVPTNCFLEAKIIFRGYFFHENFLDENQANYGNCKLRCSTLEMRWRGKGGGKAADPQHSEVDDAGKIGTCRKEFVGQLRPGTGIVQ